MAVQIKVCPVPSPLWNMIIVSNVSKPDYVKRTLTTFLCCSCGDIAVFDLAGDLLFTIPRVSSNLTEGES